LTTNHQKHQAKCGKTKMAAIKRSEQCTECGDNPRRVRKGKKFPMCEDCRRASVILRLRVRKVKRTLGDSVGKLVQFNTGDGWRTGYLVQMHERNAQVQPIGARGKVPDIMVVSLGDIKAELMQSPSCPTVADYYAKNGVKPPTIKVTDGGQPALAFK
jgi:hypothetical protein